VGGVQFCPSSLTPLKMSMSTRDYQPSRYEVASGGHSSLSPAYQPPGWAPYDARTLASSLPSVNSLPPISAALAHPGGRGRSLSEVANTRHTSQNDRRGQQYDRHLSLTVLSQGRPVWPCFIVGNHSRPCRHRSAASKDSHWRSGSRQDTSI
jgi:hypothetical protein